MHATSLDAKVAARNRTNAYANELHARLVEIFRPLVGTKVCKADGTLTAKVAAMMPDTPCDPSLHVFSYNLGYCVSLNVKACECHPDNYGDGEIANYETAEVRIGSTRGGVLGELFDVPTRRTDYTAEAVRAARKAHEEAKAALRRAYDALDGFGEYDN